MKKKSRKTEIKKIVIYLAPEYIQMRTIIASGFVLRDRQAGRQAGRQAEREREREREREMLFLLERYL